MSSSDSDESDNNSTGEDEVLNDNERTAIRSELSSLSFEELQKLKEKIGAKVYKEALFGSKKVTDTKPKIFKRENKNRPREVSSKKPVSMIPESMKVKRKELRDPRFDPLCGQFDKKQFANDYNFLSDIRMNDIKAIKAELKEATDPERVTKLKRLLQRLNEQHRASRKVRKENEKIKEERQIIDDTYNQGRQPHFKNKSELRVEALVKQYEELKREGPNKIQRHLKRRQQKLKKKSHSAPVHLTDS